MKRILIDHRLCELLVCGWRLKSLEARSGSLGVFNYNHVVNVNIVYNVNIVNIFSFSRQNGRLFVAGDRAHNGAAGFEARRRTNCPGGGADEGAGHSGTGTVLFSLPPYFLLLTCSLSPLSLCLPDLLPYFLTSFPSLLPLTSFPLSSVPSSLLALPFCRFAPGPVSLLTCGDSLILLRLRFSDSHLSIDWLITSFPGLSGGEALLPGLQHQRDLRVRRRQ